MWILSWNAVNESFNLQVGKYVARMSDDSRFGLRLTLSGSGCTQLFEKKFWHSSLPKHCTMRDVRTSKFYFYSVIEAAGYKLY